MARFRFHTRWLLDGASIDDVYDAIHRYEAWPEWWPGVEEARELEPPMPDGTGGLATYTWRSQSGYRLRFRGSALSVERPAELAGSVAGDLVGVGTWRLRRLEGEQVEATYEWDVRTARPWMTLAAPLLRPLFVRNHDRIMRDGGEALAARLGARLLER
jgi:hypothetical protein